MGIKRDRLAAALEAVWEIPEHRPHVELDRLGDSILRLPPYLWQERMFFKGAPDTSLQNLTRDFPRTIRGTHPLFIIHAASRLAVTACPCTSSPGPWTYIPRNTRLHITGRIMDRTSFLLEELSFNVPKDEDFTQSLHFWGLVPEERIYRSPR